MNIKEMIRIVIGLSSILLINFAHAEIIVPMKVVAPGLDAKEIGTVTFENARCGVLIKPNLHDLPPGIHGFHIHAKPSCEDKGMAAGSHYDPASTDSHQGPYSSGHLGDLPVLIVNNDGKATLPLLAPRYNLKDLRGHALMIHVGEDNYSDQPEKNGGGGARYACGVIG